MNEINPSHMTAARILGARQLRVASTIAPPPVDGVRERAARPADADDRGGDRVELSRAAVALAELNRQETQQRDDLRIEKVARLRSEIQNGLYDVDGKIDAIVDRILDELFS